METKFITPACPKCGRTEDMFRISGVWSCHATHPIEKKRTKILYLHGFNSAFKPESNKVKQLSKIGDVIPFSYDSLDTPAKIFASITAVLSDHLDDEVLLVGTSYGGYWAMALGRAFNLAAVALNPVVDPENVIFDLAGKVYTNYVTGEKRAFDLGIEPWFFADVKDGAKFGIKPLIMCTLGDDIINPNETVAQLKNHTQVILWTGGDHRFDLDDKMVAYIEAYYSHSTYASDLNGE